MVNLLKHQKLATAAQSVYSPMSLLPIDTSRVSDPKSFFSVRDSEEVVGRKCLLLDIGLLLLRREDWRVGIGGGFLRLFKGGDLLMGVKTGRSDMMGNFAGLSYCCSSIACETLGGMGKHR